MNRMKLVAVVTVVALATLPSLGCKTMTWLFDDWNGELGTAYHENTQKMIANPEVVDADSRPADPMDGETAGQIVDGYRAGQSKPPSRPGPSIINIGAGATLGSQVRNSMPPSVVEMMDAVLPKYFSMTSRVGTFFGSNRNNTSSWARSGTMNGSMPIAIRMTSQASPRLRASS